MIATKIQKLNKSMILPMKVQRENALSTVPYSLIDQVDDSWWKPRKSPDDIEVPTVTWPVSTESKIVFVRKCTVILSKRICEIDSA